MKSPLAILILFSFLAFTQGHAATVSGLNTKPERCSAMAPLLADLNTAQFPADWTVYVTCDPGTWQSIEQRVGGVNTGAAFTDRKQKFTIVNGMMYKPLFSFASYVQKTPERILRHEVGHIICNTSSEDVADRYANTGACHKETNSALRACNKRCTSLTENTGPDNKCIVRKPFHGE